MESVQDGAFEPYNMEAIAHHEAGHAVMAARWLLEFDWVVIKPIPDHFEGRIGDVTFSENELGMVHMSRELSDDELGQCWFGRLLMIYAGVAAESKFLNRQAELNGSDFWEAEKLAKLSGQKPAWRVEKDCRKLATSIVGDQWFQIEAVAKALIERRYLTGEEVLQILIDALGQ